LYHWIFFVYDGIILKPKEEGVFLLFHPQTILLGVRAPIIGQVLE
jgi:hypothetical protein